MNEVMDVIKMDTHTHTTLKSNWKSATMIFFFHMNVESIFDGLHSM